MKKFDVHTHLGYSKGESDLLTHLEEAGLYGACIFSYPPKEHNPAIGKDFDARLEHVLGFVSKDRERLYPVLWVHPDEPNIIDNIDKAVEAGVAAFKMICNNY